MKQTNSKKLALAAMLTAVAVAGSTLSFPIFGSRCAPVQHMVNVLCAVLLGPGYGLLAGFLASLLRNLWGLGTLLAYPGTLCGALLCGLTYKYSKKLSLTCLAEVVGTGILGGLLAYPIAIAFMGKSTANSAVYVYVGPFLISTAVGSVISFMFLTYLKKVGLLDRLQKNLER